jgi:hypothetical protein
MAQVIFILKKIHTMQNAELSSPEEKLNYLNSDSDLLSDFLRSYQNEKQWVSSEDKEFQDELIKGIERLNKILEGLIVPDKNNSLLGWITSGQVILRLEISERTLASWRKSGKLPCSKIEQKIFYQTSDLEKLLLQGYKKKVK